MPETYPFDRLSPASERWLLRGRTIGGGVNLYGEARQARNDGGGIWVCWMNDIAVETPEQLRLARGLEARLDGGATEIIVPAFEGPVGVMPQDGAWQGDYEIATAAALRATEIEVGITVGLPLGEGMKFSIVHPTMNKRLYVIAAASAVVAGVQTLTIRPPLREAVTDEAVDLNDLGCLMKLANADDFLGALDAQHESTANAVWVEAF